MHKNGGKTIHSRNIFVAFILNLVFAIIEFIGGIFTNSISIMSDSIHDLGDAISIAISWMLEKKSEQKPDLKYTFGYTRYSVLGALITTTVLLLGSIIMIYNSIIRIIYPTQINYNGMIIFAVLGLVSNGVGAYVTSRGEKLNEKAVSLHLLEDVLGWAAVLIASIVMRIFNIAILDPILSIFITVYILIHVTKNYREIFEILLDKAPSDINITKFKCKLLDGFEYIKGVYHVHVWKLDDSNVCMSLSVQVEDEVSIDQIIDVKKYIRRKASENDINHITIEIDFAGESDIRKECNICLNNSDSHHHHHHHHNHH